MTQLNIPCPSPAGGSVWGHITSAPNPCTFCQITNFKSYLNLVKIILGWLNLTCAENHHYMDVCVSKVDQMTWSHFVVVGKLRYISEPERATALLIREYLSEFCLYECSSLRHTELKGFRNSGSVYTCFNCVINLELWEYSWWVCHGFRWTNCDDNFWVNFDHFWSEYHFFEAAGAVAKIGLSLKSNHHWQI